MWVFGMFWGSGGSGSRLRILPRPQRTSPGGFQTTWKIWFLGPWDEKCKHCFVSRPVFCFLVCFLLFSLDFIKKHDLGPKNKVLRESQTKAWDHLQTIELEKLCIPLVSKVSEVEGMSSFDHFYSFYRTLKRWTTRICPRQASASPMQVPWVPHGGPMRSHGGPMQAPCRPQADPRTNLSRKYRPRKGLGAQLSKTTWYYLYR